MWLVQPAKFVELLPRIRVEWVLLSVLGYSLAIVMNVAAVRHILQSLGRAIQLATMIGIHLQAVFFNYFLPTNFGGDIYKVLAIGRRIDSSSSAVVGVVLQRSVSLVIALGLIAVGVPAFSPASVEVAGSTAIVSIALAALLILAAVVRIPKSFTRRARGHRWVKRVLERWGALFLAVHELRRPSTVIATVSLLFTSQMFNVVAAFAMARSLGLDVGWQNFIYILPVSYIAASAPISINGLGVREGVVVLMLTQLGVDRTSAAAFALAVLAVNVLFALVGGILFSFARRHESTEEAP